MSLPDRSLPDRDAILSFIRDTPTAVGKREIARAFGLRGGEREALKALLAEMEEEGLLDRGPGRSYHGAGGLPRVTVLVVTSADARRVVAQPERWEGEGAPPEVVIQGDRARREQATGRSARLTIGDRILTRISGEAPRYGGSIIKRLARGQVDLLGIVRKEGKAGLMLQPADKRNRRSWPIHHGTQVAPGTLVRAELKGSGARAVAHIVEEIGHPFEMGKNLSMISISSNGIEDIFAPEVEEEAAQSSARPLGEREDWSDIPFITIDPADARDHDDAVWAQVDGKGWKLCVAIADVGWFVRPGTALDRTAFNRGNSVYFPDRVVPMLPESLSAGACSLKLGADKAVLIAQMAIAENGELKSWSFHRATVRIAANLAYEAAQAAIDGKEENPLGEPVLQPLWGCWQALMRARARRDPLDLELPERQVLLDEEGDIAGISVRQRLDAHKVIEEMMIIANVAAARALETKKAPVMYRNHESPDREKLTSLKDYLETMGLKLALGQVITPSTFNHILNKSKERSEYTEISEAVLRAQTQAYYGPRGTGHFGLALSSYAHFTSPIRRYADVMVHRALINAHRLGEGGLPDGAGDRFAAIGEHISMTERRAMEAERETMDRYVARHMRGHLGETVHARITGVQAFGFFAAVDGTGGDGLVPVSALGDERFRYDEGGRFLEGVESGTRYVQGQKLDLLLEEADPVAGSLRFSIPGVEPAARGPGFGRRRRDGGRDPARRPARRGGPPPGVKRGRKR